MKVLIAIAADNVAPRFDLAVEAVIAEDDNGRVLSEPRLMLLSEPSGDELSALAVREGAEVVICGGIDEVHYDYLMWKKIKVIDGIIGPYEAALKAAAGGGLEPNEILPGLRE